MNNPYDAPQAQEIVAHGSEHGANASFYVVSKTKFFILFIATIGMYVIVWGYKNWNAIKVAGNLKIWPAARAIFILFYLHKLMAIVGNAADASGKTKSINYKGIANTAVIVLLVNYIIDRMTAKNIGYPITDIISFLMVFVVAFVIWTAQHAINYAADDEMGTANDSLTVVNWFWIIIGAGLWCLSIYGTIPSESTTPG